MGSPEENKALVRRFYEQIDKGNIGILDELVAEDHIDHNPPPVPGLAPGREGVKQAFRIFQQATPGYHSAIWSSMSSCLPYEMSRVTTLSPRRSAGRTEDRKRDEGHVHHDPSHRQREAD